MFLQFINPFMVYGIMEPARGGAEKMAMGFLMVMAASWNAATTTVMLGIYAAAITYGIKLAATLPMLAL